MALAAPEEWRRRAQRLLQQEIGFIPNASFRDADPVALRGEAEAQIRRRAAATSQSPPRGMPAHLSRMCEASILKPAEEQQLFRLLNYVKYRANVLRSRLDPKRPDEAAILEVEELLRLGDELRDAIVQANLRLVISVVKVFVGPQHSFDDLLSEGVMALLRGVEKFDYDRGFRFSTYATQILRRCTYRLIQQRQRDASRCLTGDAHVVLDALPQAETELLNERQWHALKQRLGEFLLRLDDRERYIVQARFALAESDQIKTFQGIADELGVSKERVRQLEQRALRKLRGMVGETPLDEAL